VACPVETTIPAIGGRRKVLVIHHLIKDRKRFGELARALEGVSARTLTRELRELAACGLIHREVYRQIPPMVKCSLTPAGERLERVLQAMHDWGEAHGLPDGRAIESDRPNGKPGSGSRGVRTSRLRSCQLNSEAMVPDSRGDGSEKEANRHHTKVTCQG
jgi:DNA-binding HxlR family transcriptional regulator